MAKMSTLNEAKICRLCSVDFDIGISIFEVDKSSQQLSTIINRYLPIKILDDGKLPKQICMSCNQSVKDIGAYFDVLVAGQRRIRELWKEQVDRARREKKLQEHLENLDEINIEIDLDEQTGDQQLFDINHTICLSVEGREVPRRRPGRPRKVKPPENALENETNTVNNTEITNQDEIVDPEEALELMFKEAEEKRLTSGEQTRSRRRRRLPQRFTGLVEGKELETILKNEGVIDPAEEEESQNDEDDAEEIILEPVVEESEEASDDAVEAQTDNEENNGENVRLNKRTTNRFKSKGRVGRPKKRRFVCEYCGKCFLHLGHFKHHLQTRHQRSQFICLSCNKTFQTKEELGAHQNELQHSGEGMSGSCGENATELNQHNEYKCLSCEQVFAKQGSLTNHIVEQHIIENPNICDLCGKTFTHSSSVTYHKEVSHSKSAYVCNVCNKGFKHKQLLQRHMLVHSDDRPFICDVCGASFKTRANLYNHSNIHTEVKPFQCTMCDAKFSHKTSLILHTRWHTGEKPFTCSVCGKSFSQGGNLQEHMRIHTGEKPFNCEVCSKRFTTSSQHRLHMKRHTGERPWKCEYCGKDFLHKDSWKCHLRRHRGEKPFACPACPRTFTEQWALKKHVRLHTGEKPYSCNICNKAFSDMSNLQKHKKTHKTQQTAGSNIVISQEEETENALSALTDGQHFFYVTADQTQLVISTIAPNETELETDEHHEQFNRVLEGTVTMADIEEDQNQMNVTELTSENGENDGNVLSFVQNNDCQMQQAIQITTEDGRRVTLIIPTNGDECEIPSDYHIGN